ncbi:hypothetical protein D7Z26_17025 [Cohnella endophytica]|uniref:Uncharacterized protein n=1 Tax=Cohnella endophytica TaxID=2419778 RepID=A0A494XLB9_9BACL|nr:hypothetical protein [Cohnella endophytica]RKP51490.1 hypothetical protein D7Z26_17025 [Cohnella endophytica]
MNSLSNPDWYDTLNKDQPLRTRTFTKELAAGIYTKALATPARGTFFSHRRRMLGAAMIAIAACVIFLFVNKTGSNVAPASPSKAGVVVSELTPQIRDALINRSGTEANKQILLEKRVGGNLELIYSAPPKSANSSSIIIDILKWTDYGGDRSVGTGLDGWSHDFGFQGADDATVMPGVTWGGITGYGSLAIFNGNISRSEIAGIRVVDGSGKQRSAHIFPSSHDFRYWFVDMDGPVEGYKIEALDSNGAVLSTYSPRAN